MSCYYNEIDPYAAQWLRNLIAAGHIAPGDVDERSIEDVRPDDVRGYTQCHFFAGIGGWSYALRLAGWPDDRPVWTGSCPCQPFSGAGKGEGFNDPRHLWPTWFRLIRECAPPIVFGEQVASAAGWAWADHVATDLEGVAYAFGAADVPAAGVGAWHIRQRLWWVADAEGRDGRLPVRERGPQQEGVESLGRGEAGELGHARRQRREVCNSAEIRGTRRREEGRVVAGASVWANTEWIQCRDGKARPTEPGLFPLAHGVSGRVGRLRAYGNAIVPQVGAEFVKAYNDAVTA